MSVLTVVKREGWHIRGVALYLFLCCGTVTLLITL